MTDTYKPSWRPDNNNDKFACRVMRGVEGGHDGMSEQNKTEHHVNKPKIVKRVKLTVDDYVKGILAGNRMILSRAITLIESNASVHFAMAQEVIQKILPYTGKSMRIGITGVPGAGKSTLIEALGTKLCQH